MQGAPNIGETQTLTRLECCIKSRRWREVPFYGVHLHIHLQHFNSTTSMICNKWIIYFTLSNHVLPSASNFKMEDHKSIQLWNMITMFWYKVLLIRYILFFLCVPKLSVCECYFRRIDQKLSQRVKKCCSLKWNLWWLNCSFCPEENCTNFVLLLKLCQIVTQIVYNWLIEHNCVFT